MTQTNLPSTAPASTAINLFDQNQFATIQRMAELYANSALVPDTYQIAKQKAPQGVSPEEAYKHMRMQAISNCVIALDIASRIGASPLMVCQNLIIIYGRPSWSSKFLISTVNTCGRFEPLQFRFTEKGKLGKFNITEYEYVQGRGKVAVTKEFDGTKIADIECVAYTTKKGSKDVLESSPISIRMAVEEGWYTKNGSKWRTMPKQMLMYRAASFWTSVYAPELSMGMRTVEENQDIIDITETAVDVTEQVEAEKASHANGEAIGFGDEANKADEPNKADTPQNVDTETGEIKDAVDEGPGY